MNFILRTFTIDKDENTASQHNRIIGSDYSLIMREEDYGLFSKMYQREFGNPHVADTDENADNYSRETYGFIIYDNGSIAQPLYKKQQNYIMTDSGKTFCNISYK